MTKYIFLDIDGVVATNNDDSFFNNECVYLVSKLANESGATIVLSSDWRFTMSASEMSKRIFEETGIPIDIEAITTKKIGNIEDGIIVDFENRGQEISEFLRDSNYGTYVILDDLPAFEFEEHRLHLVSCNRLIGFDQTAYDRAIAILNFEDRIPKNQEFSY